MSPPVLFKRDPQRADDGHDDDIFGPDEDASTAQGTRERYLAKTGAPYAKVRSALIQRPAQEGKGSQPAQLPHLARNHRAAVLFLALLANWPRLKREDDPMAAGAWIRFLSWEEPDGFVAPKNFKPLQWNAQNLSHAWRTLEDLGLIARPRKGRFINVRPLREDGSKAEWTNPQGKGGDVYFTLPTSFGSTSYMPA